jgi:hypothetical protein
MSDKNCFISPSSLRGNNYVAKAMKKKFNANKKKKLIFKYI